MCGPSVVCRRVFDISSCLYHALCVRIVNIHHVYMMVYNAKNALGLAPQSDDLTICRLKHISAYVNKTRNTHTHTHVNTQPCTHTGMSAYTWEMKRYKKQLNKCLDRSPFIVEGRTGNGGACMYACACHCTGVRIAV